MAQHRHFGKDFKAKVAIEAIKGKTTEKKDWDIKGFAIMSYGLGGGHFYNCCKFNCYAIQSKKMGLLPIKAIT